MAMQPELLKLIENFDVVSFDVLDALMVRPCLGQEDLWRDVGELRVESHCFVMRRR